jgi:transcriptional regulator with XRE-family HTH domain
MPYKLLPTEDPANRAGIRLPALRRAAGMSLRALADELHALGVVRYGKAPRLVALERGQAMLTNEQAELFARALGCTVEDIMAATDDEELEACRDHIAEVVRVGRAQKRELGGLELKLLEQGKLTKAERKRHDQLAAEVSWARSQVSLYKSRISYLEDGSGL